LQIGWEDVKEHSIKNSLIRTIGAKKAKTAFAERIHSASVDTSSGAPHFWRFQRAGESGFC
jgi:hypothetical protein